MDKKDLERQRVTELYKKYDLNENDVFKHANYLIISRSGIEKIQAKSEIHITFEMTCVNPDGTYCCIKAIATKGSVVLESYGSAKRGGKEFVTVPGQDKKKFVEHGNTETWYIAEMAEKRAKSRVVLQMEGLYKEGVFGEADDFKDKKQPTGVSAPTVPSAPKTKVLTDADAKADLKDEPRPDNPSDEATKLQKEAATKLEAKIPAETETAPAHSEADAIKALDNSSTIDELKLAWQLVKDWGYGENAAVIAAKDKCKTKLIPAK